MIVCSDCMQPVGLHKDTSQYYHLPPMKDHCDVSYVFALDLGKTPKNTVKLMKDMTEEANDLSDRIDRAIDYLKKNDVANALITLEGKDLQHCVDCGGSFYFQDEKHYPKHCPNGCCWHHEDEECDV